VPLARFAVEACEDPETGRFRAVDLRFDGTAAFAKEGDIICAGPGFSRPRAIGVVEDPLHWLRFHLTAAEYLPGRAPEIDALMPNTVGASALRTVLDEYLGASDGRPDQTFSVRHAPVAPGSLELEVGGEAGAETWREIEDLLEAGETPRSTPSSRAPGGSPSATAGTAGSRMRARRSGWAR
jgi:hypothetical protein